jgi:hypothetical protein
MRAPLSGGQVGNSSAHPTGQRGEIVLDSQRGMGRKSYLVLLGVFAGCLLFSYAVQPWLKDARFEARPQQMQAAPLLAHQPVNPQQVYSQPYQYGTAYGGVQYAAQPLNSGCGSNGQRELRVRTNVVR